MTATTQGDIRLAMLDRIRRGIEKLRFQTDDYDVLGEGVTALNGDTLDAVLDVLQEEYARVAYDLKAGSA